MTGPAETWRRVADDLAARLASHAVCDEHPLHRAQPDTCPFCDDRRAYRRYLSKRQKAVATP